MRRPMAPGKNKGGARVRGEVTGVRCRAVTCYCGSLDLRLRLLGKLLARSFGAEASARAWYLLEPDLGVRERVRRYVNERLWSLHEQVRLHVGTDDAADVSELRSEIAEAQSAAERRGYSVFRSSGQKVPRIGDPRPSNLELIGQIGGLHDNVDLGRLMYRTYSAIAHGTWHGLDDQMWSISEEGPDSHVRDDPSARATVLNFPIMLLLSGLGRAQSYFGWESIPLKSAVLQCWVLLSITTQTDSDELH
jgi:hypothetical protein